MNMPTNLELTNNLSGSPQAVKDRTGTASALSLSVDSVGIGTVSPRGALHVDNGFLRATNRGDGAVVLVLDIERSWVFKQLGAGAGTTLELTAANPNNNNKDFIINTDGRVGIGISRRPTEKLEVDGNILATGDVRLTGGDCAEEFDIEAAEAVEPGTVMVALDESRIAPSSVAYDKRVAGVISGAGGELPGIVLARRASSRCRQPLALAGKVFCKVDADLGAVDIGDLLTTSGTPGHAMLARDVERARGRIIGKALRPLARGRGLLPILVAML